MFMAIVVWVVVEHNIKAQADSIIYYSVGIATITKAID